MRTMLLLLALLLSPVISYAQTPLEDEIGPGPDPGATPEEIKVALSAGIIKEITLPGALAFGSTELEAWAKKAKSAHETLKKVAGPGNSSTSYDVILQAGHFLRAKGATGGTGKYVLEREMAAWVANEIADDLTKRGLNVAVIPADGFNTLNGKVFLSLHTDSSAFPCSVGPSIGYDSPGDALGMHGIAAALAISMGIDPIKFMQDNYTKNLKGYYAFKSMNVELFEGVLEMSELTCPKQEENLLSRAELLANNLSVAIVMATRPAQ